MLQFVDGDKLLFKALEDSFVTGMIKSLPSPGQDSSNAYLLADSNKRFFIKPTDEATCKKDLIVWQLSKTMGLEQYFLPVAVVKIKDTVFASVNPMLSDDYFSLQDFEKNHEYSMAGILSNLIKSGDAHKLAILDMLVDNFDRHRGNLMVNGRDLILIDHSRAFKKSEHGHIPGYLRDNNWHHEQSLPLCDDPNALKKWIMDLKISQIDAFNKIKELVSTPGRIDEAINNWWMKHV